MTDAPPSARAARMSDVAQLAGVSVQTVSRVVNDHPHVTPEVRERVRRAMTQLRYRRNPAARSLATRRTMSLGVVTYGLAQHGPSVALTGIVAEARRSGYTTNLVSLVDLRTPDLRRAVDHLVDDHVDGIVLLAPVEDAVRSVRAVHTDVPLVVFEPGGRPRPDTFAVDEVRGARIATEHILELGHRTVLHVSGPEGWLATDARVRGWREALGSAGALVLDPLPTSWDARSGFAAAAAVAGRPDVTAVFVANDQTALGLVRGLVEHGVRVPDDVSVVGFDDFPESAFFNPPLTTVRVDFEALGRLAVRKVLALIVGEEPDGASLVVPELVVRASSAPPSCLGTTDQTPHHPRQE